MEQAKGSITEKLKFIFSDTTCGKKVKEEINYILDEIENTDDRNSIYMSSWRNNKNGIIN